LDLVFSAKEVSDSSVGLWGWYAKLCLNSELECQNNSPLNNFC